MPELIGTVDVKDLILSLLEADSTAETRLVPRRNEPLFGEAMAPTPSYFVRTGDWKLIRYEMRDGTRWEELYDLASDPAETLDLSNSESSVHHELAEMLDGWIGDQRRDASEVGESDAPELDEQTERQLRALGYL